MSTEAIFQTQLIQKAWEDPSFKAKLLSDPKAAIKEALGVLIPDHIQVRTVEEKSDELFLIIPPNPAGVIKSEAKERAIW
ncbi:MULTISPECIES: NHLP leader peptide family RiPP precursor [Paenibacillus]|uniref:NHLP leader peptide family natural product n=1 Tax=Paenibacillus campinasensis TaxID=66347 RepID=A0A268EDS6_9BACL|nr:MULTISPECIES: NHLP leader peptide family RiPP precursor [Paenibacillus]MUG67904.1 NHLP leader peptide family natural product precursor [Paenibacillus campinasensis]PAD71269.1 NHLP leader peptide family natural product precursor [Paenibacillus campinasensis]PAK49705.1 NHLP leader peptide family natural product precursor [Paenibacillus sp. 7541]